MISRRTFVATSLCAALTSACSEQDRPLTVLIWTDSTGNGEQNPREWPYLWADAMAGAGGAVQIEPWAVETGQYGAPTRVGTGTVSIWVKNFAVPGSIFAYPMGVLWDNAFSDRPDVAIISLGLNHAKGLNRSVVVGEFVAGLERFVSEYPDVPIIYVKQNPFRDDDDMAMVYKIIDQLAPVYDLQIADVGASFEASHKDAALYLSGDGTHPSQEGQHLYADAIQAVWPPRMEVNRPSRPRMANLLTNPLFDVDNDEVLVGWSAGGLGELSFARDAELRVTCAGGYGYIYQDISPEHLSATLGQKISVAFELGLEADAADGQGRIFIAITTPGGTEMIQSRASTPPGGMQGWRAICDVQVPVDAVSIRVGVYHDQATVPSSVPLKLSNSMVVVSSFPRL